MERGVVDDVEEDFPAGAGEGGAVEAGGGEVGFEVGGGSDVGAEAGEDAGPVFFEVVEGGAGVGVGEGDGLAGEAGEPSSISVVDVLEGGEDGGMGDLEIEGELVRGEAGGRIEKLGGGPEGVVEVGEEGGVGYHKTKSRD